ncbi:MAG: hypothetical protein Ct9H300mP19_13400 [Dehalococcoidia bacterium]|nr:MAG: hypothetical protein Ct9H300mP19_13400 [Dehalococcoidia bacterium]
MSIWGPFGEPGSGDGQLNLPWEVCPDLEDNIYVADWGNDRIVKFSSDGHFKANFGSSGRGNGELNAPSSFWVWTQMATSTSLTGVTRESRFSIKTAISCSQTEDKEQFLSGLKIFWMQMSRKAKYELTQTWNPILNSTLMTCTRNQPI